MFGLKEMRRKRDLLHAKTKAMEQLASDSRQQYKSKLLNLASSPQGLGLGFIAGATTQCDVVNSQRNLLLATARTELLMMGKQYLAQWMDKNS